MKEKILKWFATGDVGISSKSMACAAVGIKNNNNFPPYTYPPKDPDDFNRCLLLLDRVPEIRNNFDKVSEIYEQWAALIERWNEVEKCFLEEAGFNWCKGEYAPKTYALMKSIGC